MNITMLVVDKVREAYVRAGCDLYARRLRPYMRMNIVEVRKATGADALSVEGDRILERIEAADVVWALERTGAALTSERLARRIGDVERSGARRLVLAIGGAEGLDRTVLERADLKWSLSELTFLHEIARLIVLEQLYRAAKIARGEPYHR